MKVQLYAKFYSVPYREKFLSFTKNSRLNLSGEIFVLYIEKHKKPMQLGFGKVLFLNFSTDFRLWYFLCLRCSSKVILTLAVRSPCKVAV
jgi:hypothetical protein